MSAHCSEIDRMDEPPDVPAADGASRLSGDDGTWVYKPTPRRRYKPTASSPTGSSPRDIDAAAAVEGEGGGGGRAYQPRRRYMATSVLGSAGAEQGGASAKSDGCAETGAAAKDGPTHAEPLPADAEVDWSSVWAAGHLSQPEAHQVQGTEDPFSVSIPALQSGVDLALQSEAAEAPVRPMSLEPEFDQHEPDLPAAPPTLSDSIRSGQASAVQLQLKEALEHAEEVLESIWRWHPNPSQRKTVMPLMDKVEEMGSSISIEQCQTLKHCTQSERQAVCKALALVEVLEPADATADDLPIIQSLVEMLEAALQPPTGWRIAEQPEVVEQPKPAAADTSQKDDGRTSAVSRIAAAAKARKAMPADVQSSSDNALESVLQSSDADSETALASPAPQCAATETPDKLELPPEWSESSSGRRASVDEFEQARATLHASVDASPEGHLLHQPASSSAARRARGQLARKLVAQTSPAVDIQESPHPRDENPWSPSVDSDEPHPRLSLPTVWSAESDVSEWSVTSEADQRPVPVARRVAVARDEHWGNCFGAVFGVASNGWVVVARTVDDGAAEAAGVEASEFLWGVEVSGKANRGWVDSTAAIAGLQVKLCKSPISGKILY